MIRFSYYPGCSLGSSTDFYDRSLRKVLTFYGIELKELDDWSCCGASAAPTVNEGLSIVLSARNIALAERSGLHLVAPCSACYARTKAAARKIVEDNDTRRMVNEALAPLSCKGNIEVRTSSRFSATLSASNGSQAPCRMTFAASRLLPITDAS